MPPTGCRVRIPGLQPPVSSEFRFFGLGHPARLNRGGICAEKVDSRHESDKDWGSEHLSRKSVQTAGA